MHAMKYPAYFAIGFALFFAACGKDEKTINVPKTPAVQGAPLTDFALIPVKDATWEIHIQGILNSDKKLDTGFHSYTLVKAMNEDSVINGLTYYLYDVRWSSYNSTGGPSMAAQHFIAYLREDTATKTLFAVKTMNEEAAVVYLHDEEPGTIVRQKPQWEIKYVDSLVVAGQYIKRWQACNSYDKKLEYLYKGYGVATQTGPLLRETIQYEGGQVISTKFTYKNSTQEFKNDVIF